MFDETYFDLAAKLLNDAGQEPREKEEWLLENLVNKMEGRFSLDAGEMSFQPGTYIEYADGKAKDGKLTYFSPQRKDVFSPNMMAEGFRKFGVLQRLLQNCSLVPGVTGSLFWDEPESNLNPQLMKLLVQTMLELSRSGQQIILATHDYVLLKWFDLLVNTDAGDHIRFHSLSRENGDVRVQSADDYRQLNSNAIANTFSDLYDEEIKRKDLAGHRAGGLHLVQPLLRLALHGCEPLHAHRRGVALLEGQFQPEILLKPRWGISTRTWCSAPETQKIHDKVQTCSTAKPQPRSARRGLPPAGGCRLQLPGTRPCRSCSSASTTTPSC
jgi:hypothetical protein